MARFEKICFFVLISLLLPCSVFAQDTIDINKEKEDLFDQIERRNWRVRIPLWIPGFTGSFAYGGITNYPGGRDFIFIDRLEGEIGISFYLIGDIQFKSKNWVFAIDGFHTTLASDLKFQNIDKIQFPGSIEGTILRGYAGFKIFEHNNIDKRLKTTIYPYGGFRYFDLGIQTDNTKILDLNPSWTEPVLGLTGEVNYKRWFFEAKADVGGFSINNHWSGFVGLDASYRFSKLFSLGLGWAYMNFNYDQEFEYKNLRLEMYLSGPIVSIGFNF